MKKPRIEFCSQAQDEHAASCRQYAHVFHYPGVICVTPAIFALPLNYRYGILLHELGHLNLQGIEHTERQADVFAKAISDIDILRKPYGRMKNLEFIRTSSIPKARRFLSEHLEEIE